MARWAGVAGLVAALALATALRWVSPDRVQDLHPRPDAVEYVEAARRLGLGDGYWLHIAGERHPPRYPLGFSVLLAPVVAPFEDARPGVGIFVVLATALGGVAGAWALGRHIGGSGAATVAAVLLAIAPLHARLSQAVMSDVPASAAVAGVSLLALRAVSGGGPSRWAMVGGATGLAATIRMPILVLLLPLAGLVLLAGAADIRRRLAGLAALAAGALVGIAPLLVYDWRVFGSPLATGYGYWVPGAFFGTQFVLGPPAGGGNEANAVFYAGALLGRSELYTWPVAALAGLGILGALGVPGPPRIVALLALAFSAALYAVQSAFFWQGERFLLPALPLIAAVAAFPVAPGNGRLVRGVGIVLVALALTVTLRGHTFEPPDRDWGEVAGLETLAAGVEKNAVVLARTNAIFFERFLRDDGADRLWMPLGPCEWELSIRLHGLRGHGSVASGDWMLEPLGGPPRPAELAARVRAFHAEGRPVYLWTFRSSAVPFFSDLVNALQAEFTLEAAASDERWPRFRVRPR